ncbi:MAG: hypoxanthine phosphoribosyltransferase [Myxococcales bacterium]|nr:hypoxanthine phosphoribosyltransferase [Myxococcales bacterium]
MRQIIGKEQIAARVRELGAQITRDYAGRNLNLVAVLKGSFLFLADLCREIQLPLTVDFLGISSYGDRTTTSGVIRITSDLTQPCNGKDVLVVEDIVDTGLTMRYLLDNLATRKPASLKVCTLLHKPSRARVKTPIDYLGFTVPDVFVIGYGLDYQGRYRNLPFIGVLDPPPAP